MSSITLEDGEIFNEEQHNSSLNDFFGHINPLNPLDNKSLDTSGGGVILATVSMTMEQREVIHCVTEVTNSESDSCVGASAGGAGVVDTNAATGSACAVGTNPTSCAQMLMSRTRTRKVTTASLSSACNGQLDIGIEVVFGDNKRSNCSTEDEMLLQGDAPTCKKRRASSTKKISTTQPKDIEPNAENEIDDDEMVFVRGASPPPKTASSSPEILAYLCSPNKPSKNNIKGKNNYARRLPSKNRMNKRIPKKQSKLKRQNKCSASLNGDNRKLSTLSSFSIASDNEKTLELCKFFLDDECFRGEDCEYMHAEFPCKFYYLGLKCEDIDEKGHKTCKFFHGGALGGNMKNALRRHIMSAPADVLGKKFCENVLSQNTRDELVRMLDAFQEKLKEKANEKNISNKKKGKANSEESTKILRQKLCFLNEQQIESLQNFNVQRPEEALNLTLWQLNSIGINKGIHLEAILATVLNSQDVDMRKLLPQPEIDKNLNEFVDEGVVDGDEDEDKRLVIDEASIEENEEELNSKDIVPDSSSDPLEQSLRTEEDIRIATNETDKRIQDLRNSKAPVAERKKEAYLVLDKLNELEKQFNVLKKKRPEFKKMNKQTKKSQHTIKVNLNRMKKNKLKAQKMLKLNDAINKTEKSKQDQSKKGKSKKLNTEISDKTITTNSFLEVETALEQLHKITSSENDQVKYAKPKASKVEEIVKVNTSKDIQNCCISQIPSEKQVVIKVEKLNENNEKVLAKTSAEDGEKMTLRSQRKVITLSPIKFSPNMEKKTVATKIVLSDIKPRRLKIPRKIVQKVDTDAITQKTSNEKQIKCEEYIKRSDVKNDEIKLEHNIGVQSKLQTVNTTQCTDDWEEGTEQSYNASKSVKTIENFSTSPKALKFDDIESNSREEIKSNFKNSIVYQRIENHNDLRQRIEEKKKYIENDQLPRTLSPPKYNNPFTNKSEGTRKVFTKNSAPFNPPNKVLHQPNYDSEEDWDKDEECLDNSNNSYNSNTPQKNSNCDGNSGTLSNDNICTVAGVPDSPVAEDIKIHSFSSRKEKIKRHFNFEMKVDEFNYDVDDTVASPTLSPVVNEIASPTYPNISCLNDYTPAMEIDGHMGFPAMAYCLHEIKMPNIEVNKPESLDKLLRSNSVDPRILKYKEKGYLDSSATPALSYFSSQQMSQYDPRRRAGMQTNPYAIDTPTQKQNPNMLLYRYLQQSPWYQGLMSTMKMQINHSIADLVRALNNFQKERLMDPSAIFDVFKLDCAGELIEIMRHIGIFIDANGFITEDKSFGLYAGTRPAFNTPAPITSTYSFMPQILPTPPSTHSKPGLLGYAPHGHSVALAPQVAEASFVSCYVEAPTFSQLTQRRHSSFPIPATTVATPPPTEDDDEECWDYQEDVPPQIPPNENPTAPYSNNKNNRNRQMQGGAAACGGIASGSVVRTGPGGKRNDRSAMRYDNRRGGGAFTYGYRF